MMPVVTIRTMTMVIVAVRTRHCVEMDVRARIVPGKRIAAVAMAERD